MSTRYDVINVRGTEQAMNKDLICLQVPLQVELYGSIKEKLTWGNHKHNTSQSVDFQFLWDIIYLDESQYIMVGLLHWNVFSRSAVVPSCAIGITPKGRHELIEFWALKTTVIERGTVCTLDRSIIHYMHLRCILISVHNGMMWQLVSSSWRGFVRWDGFNDFPIQQILDYVFVLLKNSWILFESAKQTLESVYAQPIVVWQWITELPPR